MKTILLFSSLTLLLLLYPGGNCLAADTRTEEITALIADFNSSNITRRINAAKIVTRSGFEAPELYEIIESLLKTGYNSSTDSKHIDEMSWLCKALAASGDYGYSGLLSEVAEKADSPKLKKYARKSAANLGEYAERRKVMNKTDSWDAKLTDEENRYINLLKAGDPALIRDAAKMIYRSQSLNSAVYDVVEERILYMLPALGSSTLHTDTIAWLCKALAVSGDKKYAPTLQNVISSTQNGSLRNHARKALNRL